VEAMNSEMEQLRNQLIQKGQQAYHGPLQQLSAESPEVTKLHKQVPPRTRRASWHLEDIYPTDL
jgi:hypothetical protein